MAALIVAKTLTHQPADRFGSRDIVGRREVVNPRRFLGG